jgi:hypothetical protein
MKNLRFGKFFVSRLRVIASGKAVIDDNFHLVGREAEQVELPEVEVT